MSKILSIFVILFFIANVEGQHKTNWHLMDAEKDDVIGVSLYKAQQFAGNKAPRKEIIVAVLDSGVDIEHEDLKPRIWTNDDEIPGNGKDDDNNGYIDDVNGWNFIGGPDGNVNHDTYEATRLYKKFKYKYDDALESQLSKAQLADYKIFKKVKKEVEDKRAGAEKRLSSIVESETTIMNAVKALETALDGKDLNKENLQALDTSSDPSLMIGTNMVLEALNQGEDLGTIENLRTEVLDQFAAAKERFNDQLKYAYNTDFDPRDIIGDDYNNQRELYYGNNEVESDMQLTMERALST